MTKLLIELKSIDPDEAVNLFNNVVPSLTKGLCRRIIQQGGHTPFFLREYLALMISEGIIETDTNNPPKYLLINPLLYSFEI